MRTRQQLVSLSKAEKLPRRLGEDVLPYQGFFLRLCLTSIGLSQEYFSGSLLLQQIRDPTARREPLQRQDEVQEISSHVDAVVTGVRRIRQRFLDQIQDFEAFTQESDWLVSEFSKRLTRYPVGTALGAAVSVEVDDFVDEVTSTVGSDVAAEFMDALSYFVNARSGGR